jgi:pimeloyl-ACP methyl ester carboxylesterase
MTHPFDINQFNYRSTGKGSALIWSHGLLGCMQSEDALGIYAWHRFPKKLTLLRFDAIGHGLSATTNNKSDYLWTSLAEDTYQLGTKVLGDTAVVLGGQSMGCASSLFAAILHPEWVKGLILMNPPTAWELRVKQKEYYHKVAKAAKMLGGKGLAKINAKHIDRMLPSWLIDAHKHSVLGMLDGLKSMKRGSLEQLFLAAAENDFPTHEQLAKLNIPCLILAWDGDETHPLSCAKTLAEVMPNATLHIAQSMADVDDWPEHIIDFCRQFE